MSQAYSDATREGRPHALPDIEVFEMNAHEAAAQDEDLVYKYMKRHEFRLAAMNSRVREAMFRLAATNSRVREAMFDAIVEENDIRGGWFWWACFPGCLPDGPATGPFDSYDEALADARRE